MGFERLDKFLAEDKRFLEYIEKLVEIEECNRKKSNLIEVMGDLTKL